jgi:hypothetical protein
MDDLILKKLPDPDPRKTPGVLEVSDEYRKNMLSLMPGGCTLEVTSLNGKVKSYDKIKDFGAYISRMRLDDVLQIKIRENGDVVWKRK